MNPLLKTLLQKGIRVVPGEGPTNAKLAIVGEALGEQEERDGRVFHPYAPAGSMLDRCLKGAGITRAECFLTNVVPIRPRDNEMGNLKELGLTWRDFVPGLKERLEVVKPNCVIALGATALEALCGLREITDWRGSILSSLLVPGLKVVPSFHPSYINYLGDKTAKEEIETKGSTGVVYDYGSARVSLCLDLRRAKEESRDGRFNPEPFSYNTVRSLDGVGVLVEQLLHSPEVSFDIETKGRTVVSIAFATDGQSAWTVPVGEFETGKLEVFGTLAKLFESHEGLIAQNGIFDVIMLLQHFPTKKLHFDTMVAHHTIYPELPHSLDFLSSVYTRFPYYKWMRMGGTKEQFYEYNALDAAATFQVAQRLKEELGEFELDGFFHGFVMPLWHCIFRMGLRGILIDNVAMEELDKTLETEAEVEQRKLEEVAGCSLNPRSHKQLKEYFYEQLGLTVQRERKSQRVTVDKDALKKLAKKNPVAKQVLVVRQKENLRSKLTKARWDFDGRARTIYSQSVTDTGRLSSKKTLWDTGLNLQNVPREEDKRKMFIADPGFVLVKYDLQQAEVRLVAWFARDERLKTFLRKGGDIHKWNASHIFEKKIEDILPDERYFAKRIVHAFNYGLGPLHLMDLVRMEFGKQWSKVDATRVRGSYFKNAPQILVWHEEIRQVMMSTRTLVNPFGRRRSFFGRAGEDLFRKMLAFLPQSSCVDCLDLGMVRIDLRLKEPAVHLLQAHDEGVVMCLPEQVEEVASTVREELGFPIIIHNDPLIIPVEIKAGKNWGEMKEV